MNKCTICNGKHGTDFVVINPHAAGDSGIQVAINKQGMMRIRYFDNTSIKHKSEEIVKLIHCPICGCLKNPIL